MVFRTYSVWRRIGQSNQWKSGFGRASGATPVLKSLARTPARKRKGPAFTAWE
jgi:hypothetical protein